MDPNVANLIGVISSMIAIIGAVAGTIGYLQRKERDPKVIIGAIIVTLIFALLLIKFSYNTPSIAPLLPTLPKNPIIIKPEASPLDTPLPSPTLPPDTVTPSPSPSQTPNGVTFSAPSIFVRSNGEADIVAQGPNNSLWYYWATPGSSWSSAQVDSNGRTTSAPSIFVRPNGEADIVAQGPNNSLWYYWATPGSSWSFSSIS